MSLNATPQGERVHIGIFGNVNAGKSSLINAMTGQEAAIVSEVRGTTTDPVYKTMELLPLGPVALIDTPGLDDSSELGAKRVRRVREVLRKTDIVLLVTEAGKVPAEEETSLAAEVRAEGLPLVVAVNKTDLSGGVAPFWREQANTVLSVSARTGEGVAELKESLSRLVPQRKAKPIVRDLVPLGKTCVLVTPIDSAAPKGRLILPQQQTIRDLLEGGALPLVTRESELERALASLKAPPALVVTDSQAFAVVSGIVPPEVPLTSFSILFARYKGNLGRLIEGALALDGLRDGNRVLISEGCTHHRQCDDIGTVKLPGWIRRHSGAQPSFEFSSGSNFPEDLSGFRLIVHCGGCMLNAREMQARLRHAAEAGVPMANYGVAISHMNGVLERCVAPFGNGTWGGN